MQYSRKSLLVQAVKRKVPMLIVKAKGTGARAGGGCASAPAARHKAGTPLGHALRICHFPKMTMSHICPVSHLKKLKVLTAQALGKAAGAIATQALESPRGCSQAAAHERDCPSKSPELVISGTPAASERLGVIQGGY